MQMMIDCGFLDAEDTRRTREECCDRFFNRGAAMYLNGGTIPRFTQNEDGTGDRYGIMPFLGLNDANNVLITKPLVYFSLSKSLSEPGNEQKLKDALKFMEPLKRRN